MLHLAHGYIQVNGYLIQRCCLCGTQLVKLHYKDAASVPLDPAVYKHGTWVWIEQNEEGVPDHQVIDPPVLGMGCLDPRVVFDSKQMIHTYLCTEV